MDSSSEAVVREFWRLMSTNRFEAVAAVLSEDFVLEWPQSNERIRGAAKFAQVNAEYPTETGEWQFELQRLVAGEDQAVSHVAVSDGEIDAQVISFFRLQGGKIAQIVEFWPEPYPAPENRLHLTEPIDPDL